SATAGRSSPVGPRWAFGSPERTKESPRPRRRRPRRPSLRDGSKERRRSQEERTVLPDDQLLAFRKAPVRRTDGRIAADEAVHDLVAGLDDRLSDHDGRLDVGAGGLGCVPDGGVGPAVGRGCADAISRAYGAAPR